MNNSKIKVFDYSEILNRILEKLKRIPEVKAIILFGSYAKNKQKPTSDIDLAIYLEPYNEDIAAEVSGHSNQIIHVHILNEMSPLLKFSIIKEGKVLYLKDENVWIDLKYKIFKEYHDHVEFYKRLGLIDVKEE